MIDKALKYAARGWHVGQCHPRRKQSLRHYFDHTIDPDKIRSWWTEFPDANLNVLTGKISNLISVDIDGPQGRAFWEETFGPIRCPEIVTPRGSHLLFLCPTPFPTFNLHPEIDVCADDGQTMMPPSVHPNGLIYHWRNPHLLLNAVPVKLRLYGPSGR